MSHTPSDPFTAEAFLDSAGVGKIVKTYARRAVIFRQGDPADHVFYIQQGSVRLSVTSSGGRRAIVATLGPGQFFGEGCLAAQRVRLGTATAALRTTLLAIERTEMARLFHQHHALSDRFIAHMLIRNRQIEESLVDQLFNSSEKRLARALLLLASYGAQHTPGGTVPPVSQETLAEMVGTTRSRVNVFMKKFERLGFIEYANGLQVHHSLLTVVLSD